MNYSKHIKCLLNQAIEEMSSSSSDFVVDPERDFTRNRKISFRDTLHMLLTMEGDCIQEELYRFFGRKIDAPSKAAFCKQRQKLSGKALPTLFNMFNSKLPVSLYKGKYRLLACDGSSAEIFRDPNDHLTFFEPHQKVSSAGFNLIYINAMYSILDNRFVDLVVQPGRVMNEFIAFCSMVDKIGKNGPPIIYFGDRGYTSYNNFAHVIENGHFFLIRSNDRMLQGILGRPVDDLREMDSHVDLILTKSPSVMKKAERNPGTRCKRLSDCSFFEYLDDVRLCYNMSLRIVRFEIGDGIFENIITNLPDREFAFDDFKSLYFLRWNEETAYRNLKYPLCLTAFHSKKYGNIVQEIWARAILYNFSTAIINSIKVDKSSTLHEYQVNFAEAFKTCREFL